MESTKRGKRGSNHEASQTRLPNLPQEIITEIFLRSHARSLRRFRCVSKPFCSLLSDPKFTKNHVDHNAVRLRHHRLILFLNNLFAVDLDSICDHPLKQDLDFVSELKFTSDGVNSPVIYKKRYVHIFGSSNGLVCIYDAMNDVFLYNPTTLESKKLPDLPQSLRSKHLLKTWFSYGFGFDSLTNDYKVVKFVYGDDDSYVYSMKTGLWRRISNMPYKNVYFTTSVEHNGAIHWISTLSGEKAPSVVMAFDLKTEKFRVMSLPDLAEECDHIFRRSTVGTLKGCLSVVHYCNKMHDVIWVMNEYGLESSWSKIRISVSYKSMKLLCSIKNDEEVLLLLDGHLVLYNFERNTWRNLEIPGFEFHKFLHANTYVESLISPNSYGIEK